MAKRNKRKTRQKMLYSHAAKKKTLKTKLPVSPLPPAEMKENNQQRLWFTAQKLFSFPPVLTLLKQWQKLFFGIVIGVLTNMIAAELAPTLQMKAAIQHPLGFVIFCFLAIITIVCITARLYLQKSHLPGDPLAFQVNAPRQLFFSRIQLVCTSISLGLVSVVLFSVLLRPSWCPSFLCPVSIPPSPHGVHDSYLDADLRGIAGDYYAVTGGISNLPNSSSAEKTLASRIDLNNKPPRFIVQVSSLQTGKVGIYITDIILSITEVLTLPPVLKVHPYASPEFYPASSYQGTYHGERVGRYLTAIPQHFFMRLKPREAQSLDIQIKSNLPASFTFKIHIVYQVMNENTLRSLTLPDTFHVIFSGASNWSL